MSFFKSTGRRPGIEALEAKQLLAGDVLVGVVGGNLIITGDEMGNNISVESGAEPGQYLIHGRQDTNVTMSKDCPSDSEPVQEDAGSENVDAENVVVVNGVKRGARIRMADGDDTVVIENARFAGNVSINMGEGHDSVNVGDQLVFGPPRFPPGFGTNPAQSISTINATSESSSFVGRITQVENDGEVRVENGTGKWETFTYDANTEVVDAAGNDVPLDELEGAKVRVTYHTEGIKQVADKIQVSRVQVNSVTPHSSLTDEGLADRPGEHQGPGRPNGPGEHQGPGQPNGPGEHQGPGRPNGPGEHQGPGRPNGPGEHQGPGQPNGPGNTRVLANRIDLANTSGPADLMGLAVVSDLRASPSKHLPS